MCLQYDADYRVVTQALNFFARKFDGKIDKLIAIKLVYLADRYHLREYGRPVTGDAYYAMRHGPVGSLVKDIANKNDFQDSVVLNYANIYLGLSENKKTVVSKRVIDAEEFSESDEEELIFAYTHFGQLTKTQLMEITHGYPEWKQHERALTNNSNGSFAMDYENFFEDPNPRIQEFVSVGKRDIFTEVSSEEKVASTRMLAKDLHHARKALQGLVK